MNPDNFISIDLRNALDADADRAAQKGDGPCAEILRQMAAYTGADAPQMARDLEVTRCTKYASAKELMHLVVIAKADAAEQKQKSKAK